MGAGPERPLGFKPRFGANEIAPETGKLATSESEVESTLLRVKSQPAPKPVPEQPTGLELSMGDEEGELSGQCNGQPGVVEYFEIQFTTGDPLSDTPKWQFADTSKKAVLISPACPPVKKSGSAYAPATSVATAPGATPPASVSRKALASSSFSDSYSSSLSEGASTSAREEKNEKFVAPTLPISKSQNLQVSPSPSLPASVPNLPRKKRSTKRAKSCNNL